MQPTGIGRNTLRHSCTNQYNNFGALFVSVICKCNIKVVDFSDLLIIVRIYCTLIMQPVFNIVIDACIFKNKTITCGFKV